MSGHVQIGAFWQRWQYKPDAGAELAKLRTRVEHVVKEKIWPAVYRRPDFWKQLALLLGREYDDTDVGYLEFEQTALRKVLGGTKDLLVLVQALQFTLWSVDKVSPGMLDGCVESLNEVFALSPTVLIHAARSSEGATIYPGGAALLDDTLIQENLVWLEDHPSTLKAFEQALGIYLSKDASKYRNLLDNLRFAVEQLLRDILGNQKSLENQKDTLLPWMKGKGLHAHVTGMYHDLLFKHFALYQNDAVKHGEKYSPQEIEFMIYLTGTFMRLLIQASKQPIPSGGG
jgi:hypothetical protein